MHHPLSCIGDGISRDFRRLVPLRVSLSYPAEKSRQTTVKKRIKLPSFRVETFVTLSLSLCFLHLFVSIVPTFFYQNSSARSILSVLSIGWSIDILPLCRFSTSLFVHTFPIVFRSILFFSFREALQSSTLARN